MKKYIKIGLAAKIMKVSDQTVRNYCNEGILDYIRMGRKHKSSIGHRKISVDSIYEYMGVPQPEIIVPTNTFCDSRYDIKRKMFITKPFHTYVKAGARSRNIFFNLSRRDIDRQWFKQKGLCAITRCKIFMPANGQKQAKAKCNITPKTASPDRIDSRMGYFPLNFQFIHKIVNRMKLDMRQEDFIEWCRSVAKANPL
jgi:hypothetical protein